MACVDRNFGPEKLICETVFDGLPQCFKNPYFSSVFTLSVQKIANTLGHDNNSSFIEKTFKG